MSDAEKAPPSGGKAGGGWSDKERLVYLFALMDQTGAKLDFKNTPRPNGRSEIACQRMVERLKTTIKDELEALKSGAPFGNTTPTPKSTPKKRATPKAKAKTDGEADDEGSPKKRGRKKTSGSELETIEKEAKMEVKAEDALDEI